MKMQVVVLILALVWINEAHSASRVFLKDWQENEFNQCLNDTVEKTLLASDKKIVAFLRYNYGQRSAPFLSLDAEFLIENRDGSAMKAVAIELVSASSLGWVPTTEDGFYLSYYSDGMMPKAQGFDFDRHEVIGFFDFAACLTDVKVERETGLKPAAPSTAAPAAKADNDNIE